MICSKSPCLRASKSTYWFVPSDEIFFCGAKSIHDFSLHKNYSWKSVGTKIIKRFCNILWKFQWNPYFSYRYPDGWNLLHFVSILLDKEIAIFDSARTCEYIPKKIQPSKSQSLKYFCTKLKFFWKLLP